MYTVAPTRAIQNDIIKAIGLSGKQCLGQTVMVKMSEVRPTAVGNHVASCCMHVVAQGTQRSLWIGGEELGLGGCTAKQQARAG